MKKRKILLSRFTKASVKAMFVWAVIFGAIVWFGSRAEPNVTEYEVVWQNPATATIWDYEITGHTSPVTVIGDPDGSVYAVDGLADKEYGCFTRKAGSARNFEGPFDECPLSVTDTQDQKMSSFVFWGFCLASAMAALVYLTSDN